MTSALDFIRDALAVSPSGLTATQLHRLLSGAGIRNGGSAFTANAVVALLDEAPEISWDRQRYTLEEDGEVEEILREGRLKSVLDAIAEVDPPGHIRYGSMRMSTARRELLRALLDGEDLRTRLLIREFGGSGLSDLEELVLRRPQCVAVMGGMTTLGQQVCLEHGLFAVVHHRLPALRNLEAASRELLRSSGSNPTTRYLTAKTAFLRGDLALCRERLGSEPAPMALDLEAALALFAGDVPGACKRYQAWLAAQRKRQGSDLVPTGDTALFLPLAYLLSGTKSRVKQALKLIERAQDRGWIHTNTALGGWPALRALHSPKHKPATVRHPVGAFFYLLVQQWRGEVDTATRDRASLDLRFMGLDLFADELDAGEEGRLARLRETRSAWKDSLEALSRALTGSAAPQVDGPDERLAWTLYGYDLPEVAVAARVQKRTKKGWSKGRKVATQRLHAGGDPDLPWTPADRAIARGLRLRQRRNYRGYLETEESWEPSVTWRGLVDHPALFNPDGEPVRVVGRTPSLEVVPHEGGHLLRVSPSIGTRGVNVECVGRDFEVVAIGEDQRAAIELIGSGLVFPDKAAAQLEALLGQAAEVFPPSAPSTEVREADARVHLLLRPRKSGIEVELAVLPAGLEGPRLVPGQGRSLVLASVEGQAARLKRDLKLERAWLEQARALPGLQAAEPDEHTHLELDLALELLAEARDQDVPMSWPDGGVLRVTRPGSGSKFRLSSAAEWFEASGSMQTEDGDVVSLVALARQLLGTRQRFIALDDGAYLELTATLRDQLDMLARIGTVHDDRIRVHPLATSALSGLLQLDQVEADEQAAVHLRGEHEPHAVADVPRGLKAELRPYQLDAFRWLCGLAAVGAGGILADDMGLGKTITALALLLHRRKDGPALVIAPTSVAGNWIAESARFAPDLQVVRLRDLDGLPQTLGPGDLVVCTYGLLIHRLDALVETSWSTVVFDESQAIKNHSTQRHQAALRLKARMRLALTGTPIENHLGELHAQLSVVLPGLLGSRSSFDARFSRPIESGDRAIQRGLKALVQPFLLRRTKAAVLPDLPPRTDKNLLIPLGDEERILYEAERASALESLDEDKASAMDVLGRLTRLRQLACTPELVVPGFQGESAKTRAFRRLCRDLAEAGHRTLVFSQFVKHLTVLRRVLEEESLAYLYLDGGTKARQRSERVEAFQRGDAPFFLVSLKAGGTGLNLTAADYVLHMDPWWNPAVEDQASDRAHRYGQQRPVTVYRLIAEDTVEQKIVELHRSKRDLADQILAGTDTARRLSADQLLSLLRDVAD